MPPEVPLLYKIVLVILGLLFLLVGMQTCAATVEISVAVSQETGSQPTSGPSNSTLGNIPKRCPIILQKPLFNYVHTSTTCNSQNLETT